jgi:hypothetical protein
MYRISTERPNGLNTVRRVSPPTKPIVKCEPREPTIIEPLDSESSAGSPSIMSLTPSPSKSELLALPGTPYSLPDTPYHASSPLSHTSPSSAPSLFSGATNDPLLYVPPLGALSISPVGSAFTSDESSPDSDSDWIWRQDPNQTIGAGGGSAVVCDDFPLEPQGYFLSFDSADFSALREHSERESQHSMHALDPIVFG